MSTTGIGRLVASFAMLSAGCGCITAQREPPGSQSWSKRFPAPLDHVWIHEPTGLANARSITFFWDKVNVTFEFTGDPDPDAVIRVAIEMYDEDGNLLGSARGSATDQRFKPDIASVGIVKVRRFAFNAVTLKVGREAMEKATSAVLHLEVVKP